MRMICGFLPIKCCKCTTFLAAILACVLAENVQSQDIHFSQFFTTPLANNSAQTGNFNGNYRIGFNAKLQWPALTTTGEYTYHTESPYVDFSFGEKKIKTGWMGLGLNFLNDEAGDGRLRFQRIGLSFAYHQALDKEQRYVLSAGAGMHYIIRSVDFSKFYFNNQWIEDQGFDLSQSNYEPLQRESFSMIDVNAGLNFRAQINDFVSVQAGAAVLHINRPKQSFLSTDERLGLRYQANAGALYSINERISISLDAYYTFEKRASEIQLASLFSYGFLNNRSSVASHTLLAGLSYRVKDALAPIVGYQFKSNRILLSYDITLSKLSRGNRANGGPELSFVHVGKWNREFNGKKVFCPKF